MAPQCRREPCVEHALILLERTRRFVYFLCRFAGAARNDHVAVGVVPGGYSMAPPELPRDAPVVDTVEPIVVRRTPMLGHETHPHFVGRMIEVGHARIDRGKAEFLQRLAR